MAKSITADAEETEREVVVAGERPQSMKLVKTKPVIVVVGDGGAVVVAGPMTHRKTDSRRQSRGFRTHLRLSVRKEEKH